MVTVEDKMMMDRIDYEEFMNTKMAAMAAEYKKQIEAEKAEHQKQIEALRKELNKYKQNA